MIWFVNRDELTFSRDLTFRDSRNETFSSSIQYNNYHNLLIFNCTKHSIRRSIINDLIKIIIVDKRTFFASWWFSLTSFSITKAITYYFLNMIFNDFLSRNHKLYKDLVKLLKYCDFKNATKFDVWKNNKN